MVLHALDATANDATELLIHFPDIYPELCMKTSFITGTGQNLHVIEPGSIASALGRAKLATLPTFHALSGADKIVVGSDVFLVNENVHAGKAFRDADEDVINALGSLGTTPYPEEETVALVEKYVCQLYKPRKNISKVKDLHWCKLKKNQAQSDNSPGPLPDDC